MNDRLGDLGGGTPSWVAEDDDDVNSGGGGGGWDNEDSGGHDEEKGGSGGGSQPEHMEKFFRHVDFVKEDIDAVKEATKRIGEINEEAVLATTTSKESELSRILRPIVDETNKRAKRTKNLLALLKEENEKLKKEKDTKASDMRYVRGRILVVDFARVCCSSMCAGIGMWRPSLSNDHMKPSDQNVHLPHILSDGKSNAVTTLPPSSISLKLQYSRKSVQHFDTEIH